MALVTRASLRLIFNGDSLSVASHLSHMAKVTLAERMHALLNLFSLPMRLLAR